jgi:hypothetical protein
MWSLPRLPDLQSLGFCLSLHPLSSISGSKVGIGLQCRGGRQVLQPFHDCLDFHSAMPPLNGSNLLALDRRTGLAYAGAGEVAEGEGMDEREWLNSTSLWDMLTNFPAKWDARKLDLFGCACLRRVWHLLKDSRSRNCVEIAERVADGQGTQQEVADAWALIDEADNLEDEGIDSHDAIRDLVCYTDPFASLGVASETAEGVGGVAAAQVPLVKGTGWSDARTEAWQTAERAERRALTDVLRCVFGNPFRPISLDPACRTPTVAALATAACQERIPCVTHLPSSR